MLFSFIVVIFCLLVDDFVDNNFNLVKFGNL